MRCRHAISQVAEKLAVNHKTIRTLVANSKMAGFKVGGAIRISESAVINYLDEVKITKPLPEKVAAKKRPKATGFKYL